MLRVTSRKTITIVGGGLAGLTLGIVLRDQDVPVVIWEAGSYPRHRVCGEFVNGRGLETLQRLGLMDGLVRSGAQPAYNAAFYYSDGHRSVRDLPKPAICLSRYTLDAWLAGRFLRCGGELRCGARWQGPFCQEGVVCASGRAAQAGQGAWRWYGLKAHASHIPLAADLEMHLAPNSYVGLCRLPDGIVNVCGLFRRKTGDPSLPEDVVARFSLDRGATLRERFRRAEWDQRSMCAVGGLPLRGGMCRKEGECHVGDAFAMIPPITGNGMSLAFESAELAWEPLCAYANGRISWDAACRFVEKACCRRFARRLRWAGWLHVGLFQTRFSSWMLSRLGCAPLPWRLLFDRTR